MLMHGYDSASACSQVFKEFQIEVDADALLSRCSKCNGEFIDRCADHAAQAASDSITYSRHALPSHVEASYAPYPPALICVCNSLWPTE